MTEATHPRDVLDLIGHEAAEAAFAASLARGRLHHAWLLCGPEGIGKATFAYRAARRLLGARAGEGGALAAAPGNPVSRLITARSHPDLFVLERLGEDGKPRRVIPVDEARKLSDFFAKSPAQAPFRVAIVDAADDLNPNAANALLKTLEEPPARGVLLLVSHTPGALLPTLRSRCRRLTFQPPGEAAVTEVLQRHGLSGGEALARMAQGSPGRALALAAADAVALDEAARALVAALPRGDPGVALGLTDRFRGADGLPTFLIFFDLLAQHAQAETERRAGEAGAAALWSEAWSALGRIAGETEALNLDRADALHAALA
ncbi:MAG TPA: DNA polymerase III subunit delta', partial [Phenylobacterium sp.]|nr:DNA polymerase III subunit delta' [Phenylobacterium sp.]